MIQMRLAPFDVLNRANRMRDPSGDQLAQRGAIPVGSWVSWASPVPSGLTVYIWLVVKSVKAIRPSAGRPAATRSAASVPVPARAAVREPAARAGAALIVRQPSASAAA